MGRRVIFLVGSEWKRVVMDFVGCSRSLRMICWQYWVIEGFFGLVMGFGSL